ncbi:MAG: hypothetical protein ACOX2S_02500 [bacterium]
MAGSNTYQPRGRFSWQVASHRDGSPGRCGPATGTVLLAGANEGEALVEPATGTVLLAGVSELERYLFVRGSTSICV